MLAAPATLSFDTWLQEGQRLEARGLPIDALACYDRALAEAVTDNRARSVAWMNRGSALQRLGDASNLAEALSAYDSAIALQRTLPLHDDSGVAVSLAAALVNRAVLLHRLNGTDRAADALAAGDEAVARLRPLLASRYEPAARRNLAGTFVNRANLLLDLGDFTSADAAACEALSLLIAHQHADFDAAGIALMARRARCDALGRMLVLPGADQESIAREASDVVDEALTLVRHWTPQGEGAFAPLATRLFRFGARLYRFHQPQFLAEFLLEHLESAPVPDLFAIADETLSATLADLQRPQLLVAGTRAAAQLVETAHSLRAALARLPALRASASTLSS